MSFHPINLAGQPLQPRGRVHVEIQTAARIQFRSDFLKAGFLRGNNWLAARTTTTATRRGSALVATAKKGDRSGGQNDS
jgi:hypothetical protein